MGGHHDHRGRAGGYRIHSGGADETQRASLAALIAIQGAIFAVVAALVRISTRRHLPQRGEGLLLGAAAGALWGVSDIALKYLTQAPPGPVLGLVSPWTLTALIAGLIAFYASARRLQIGDGVEVIALTSVTANLTATIGAILVFHEPIGSGALGITGRFFGVCLVIAGAALMPAPMRATPDAAGTVAGRPARPIRRDAWRPVALAPRDEAAPLLLAREPLAASSSWPLLLLVPAALGACWLSARKGVVWVVADPAGRTSASEPKATEARPRRGAELEAMIETRGV